MQVDVNASYTARVKQALADENLRIALDRATSRLSGKRAQAMAVVDAVRIRHEARAIRETAVANLPSLLQELETNLTANGCHVHWAVDAAEAQEIVRDIARHHGAHQVVKSKSMVTEEIRLNDFLKEAGIEVIETDLGEYIVQLAHEPPSHITAPVVHMRAEDISELFQRELGMEPTTDPAKMCAFARRRLRSEFLRADMGISGCNFAIAETGTVCVITNEGNGRMVTTMPPVHVTVMGIEKVVPRVEDAILLWQAVTRSATGQDASVYFSLSSGPRSPEHPDGPDEMHVVLIDNGRSRILERGYAEALLCVRCGACLNACPVYREIGGHAYGNTAYSGPIGAVLTPLLADDPSTAKELPFASSLCGVCRDVCPVKIDLPRLLLDLRSDMTLLHASAKTEVVAIRTYARAMDKPSRYRRLARIARSLSRLLPRDKSGGIAKLPPPMSEWTRSRAFPRPATKTFRDLWRERDKGKGDLHP